MYTVAILGCENSHANNFLKAVLVDKIVDDIEFVGVYSYDSEAAAKLNAEFGVPVADSYDAFVGKVLTVLSEGVNEKGIPTGRSSGNKIVTFDTPVPQGIFCKVKIDTARQYALSGSVQD